MVATLAFNELIDCTTTSTSAINPSLTNIPLLYPLKSFSDVSRVYRSGVLVENRFKPEEECQASRRVTQQKNKVFH